MSKVVFSSKLIPVLMTLVIIVFSCNPTPKRKKLTHNNELKEVQYGFDNPPKFVKEGELRFFDKNDKSEIALFDIEIASDEAERTRGLMYRKTMGNNQGMLFIFEIEEIQSFWMRNTLIPLDMIFVNRNNEIVTIHKNTKTLSDQSYPSSKPAIYVIELNAGTCDSLGIKTGDIIDFILL